MAKAEETKNLLIGRKKAQGWRDQLGGEAQTEGQQTPASASNDDRKQKYRRKTYLMTDELIQRIEEQAEKNGVGINEMNRYLLTVALDLVESGTHTIEVQTEEKRTLGV